MLSYGVSKQLVERDDTPGQQGQRGEFFLRPLEQLSAHFQRNPSPISIFRDCMESKAIYRACAWVFVICFGLCEQGIAQTYVNQHVRLNDDGTYSTNWSECLIEGAVTWTASHSPYVVDQYDMGITIKTNGLLTIEPGAVVEFVSSRDWSGLQVFGELRATGGVVFRRFSGQTNGTWSGIRFLTNSVGLLDQVTIEDAGHVTEGWQAWHPGTAIYVEDSSPTIRHATISRCQGHGIRVVQTASPRIENSRFEECAGHAILWTHLKGTPVFEGNSGGSNHLSAIYVGNGTLNRNWTMQLNSIPYVLEGWDGNLTVASNATLTIPPGAVLKCAYGRDGGAIDVYGELRCGGTGAPAILTSMEDDSVAGDTNNSTNAVYRGAWSGIRFQAGSRGLIENTEIRYSGHVTSGWQAAHPGAAIQIDSASPTIRQCWITEAEGAGVKLVGSASASVVENRIDNSGSWAVFWSAFAGSPELSDNRGTNNNNDGIYIPNGTITSNVVFHPNPGLPYVTVGWDGVFDIDPSAKLTILPGVIVKNAFGRDGGAIVVRGQLDCQGTANQPVILTSMEDDIQGDTGKTTNNVYAGSWSGVRVYPPGQAKIAYTQIRYSGHVTEGWQGWHPAAAVYVKDSFIQLDHVTIDHAQDLAVRINSNDAALRNCVFKGGPRGLWVEGGGTNSLINGSEFLGISDYAVINGNPAIEFDARNNWWGDITGPGGAGSGKGAKASEHVVFAPYFAGVQPKVYVGIGGTLQPPSGVQGPFEIVSGPLPEGLVFDPATGFVAGTATAPGSALVGVRSTASSESELRFYYVFDVQSLAQSPPDRSERWTDRPTLSWLEFPATSYHLQVATDPNFNQLVVDVAGLDSNSQEIGPLAANRTYYWRVNSPVEAGAWSPTATFGTWGSGPVSAYALEFDGFDDQIDLREVPDISHWPAWSVTAWIKAPKSIVQPYPTIFSYGYWGESIGLNRESGVLESWLDNWSVVRASKPVPPETWSFIAMVSDGTNRVLYLNGEEVGRGPGWKPAPDARATIGAVPGGRYSSHYNGAIDELAVWQTALDAAAVGRCMNRRLCGREANLAQLYHFDEGAGALAFSPAGDHGIGDLLNRPIWITSDAGPDWTEVPDVRVAFVAGKLQLSWRANQAFVVEKSLGLLTTSWQPVNLAPVQNGKETSLLFELSDPACFYRLRSAR